MAARKKIWDLQAEGGPVEVEMWAVDADDAAKHDPDRYTYEAPDGSAGAVEIPNDWADLPNSKRRGLAMRLGADNTIKVTEVNAFIEAEIDRRAALKQPSAAPEA